LFHFGTSACPTSISPSNIFTPSRGFPVSSDFSPSVEFTLRVPLRPRRLSRARRPSQLQLLVKHDHFCNTSSDTACFVHTACFSDTTTICHSSSHKDENANPEAISRV
jgi:hypothetical protein